MPDLIDQPIKVQTGAEGTKHTTAYQAPTAKATDGTTPGDIDSGLGRNVDNGKSGMGPKIDKEMPKIAAQASDVTPTAPNPPTAAAGAQTLSETKPGIATPPSTMPSKIPETLGSVKDQPNLGVDGQVPKSAAEPTPPPSTNLGAIAGASRAASIAGGASPESVPPVSSIKAPPKVAPSESYDSLAPRSKKIDSPDEENPFGRVDQGRSR